MKVCLYWNIVQKNGTVRLVKNLRMIEVFKTNVNCADKAKQLVEQIHETFECYRANFDLNDCNRILRIVSSSSVVAADLIKWLKKFDCHAEILNA